VTLTKSLTLLVGARYDDLSYFYHDFITPAINASRRFTQVSPRGGISWHSASGTTLFASYGTGVEIPAGNETDPPPTGIPNAATALNPLLDVVQSRTIEAGVRHFMKVNSRVLQGILVDAAIYRVMVNGEPVPYNGGRFYLTAGKVRRQGLELAVSGDLVGGLSARLSGTFSRNTYDHYVVDSTYLGSPGATVVLDGNRVAGLPGRVLNASVRWQAPTTSTIFVELGAQHASSYFADDVNAVNVPGFTNFRATASGDRPFGGVVARISLSVENLTNVKYVGSAFINPDYSGGEPLVYEAGLPRSMVLGITLRRSR
jgi:outer membrane receptor protein involved in Fe transport